MNDGPPSRPSRASRPVLIGAFVLGALVLIVAAVLASADGRLFARKDSVVMHFSGSIFGLQVGAPVVFRGVRLGSVTSIGLSYDAGQDRFSIPVVAELDPELIDQVGAGGTPRAGLRLETLVERGLRAQLQMQSLLTGQLYVDLDFRADRQASRLGARSGMIEIPTVTTAIQDIKNQVDGMDLRRMVDDLASIARSVRQTVGSPRIESTLAQVEQTAASLNRLAERLDRRSGPLLDAADRALGDTRRSMDDVSAAAARVGAAASGAEALLQPDAPLMRSLGRSADELARTAAALRETAEAAGPDSALQQKLEQTLDDLSRAARSLRALSDTLEQQPRSLLTGRPQELP